MTLDVIALSKTYRSGKKLTRVIGKIDFTVAEREFVTIVGPSGAGKTTLLRCIAGLIEPSSGYAALDGARIVEPPAGMAAVFQDYSRSLLGWLTVRKNVALPIRRLRSTQDRENLVDEALDAVGLSKFADYYPWQLSGGMQQRVAIARALAYRPRVILMDEPFASVDAQTRSTLEDLVLRVTREFGMTAVLVTHDVDEAVYMGDRVLALTASPTTVADEIVVDLPRDRDQILTKELPAFGHLRGRVLRIIKHGVPAER